VTRWLDADEQRAWRAYLTATQLLQAQLDRELQRDSGIPHAYYEILVRLSEAPGRVLRMSELADAADSSRSRLSHAVARLEQTGWVRRESCPTDRRGSFARLTDEGFAALEAAAPAHVESVRRHLVDRLTPVQLQQLREISEAILSGLRPGSGACSGDTTPGDTTPGDTTPGDPAPETCREAG
jgi:DNA-binding MarR family transcriptional regulator